MDAARLARREAILQGLDPTGLRGIEVGPLDRPLVSKVESEVYYLDYCSAEDLKAKYAADPNVKSDEIVDVDFLWGDEPATHLLSGICPLDFVIASHVIEHVPDLIGWLHEMRDILREGGSLILAVPDKRFTFDIHRQTSLMSEIRRAYTERRRRPGLRCIMDYYANVVQADPSALWRDYSILPELSYSHAPSILSIAAERYTQGQYIDVHCWVFTPWSFLKTLGRIVNETGLAFNLRGFETTSVGNIEFYVRIERVTKSMTDWELEAAVAHRNALWPENSSQSDDPAVSYEIAGRASPSIEAESKHSQLAESLRAKLEESLKRAELAEAQRSQLASRVAALENSTFWRLTAPMRAIVDALRG